jgi:3-(3-hydroxy-phenyl)propionate hydroxylase
MKSVTDFSKSPGAMIPGTPAADAPVRGPVDGADGEWLLGYLGGTFTLLGFADAVGPHGVASLARDRIPCKVVVVGSKPVPGATALDDVEGLAVQRYDARPGTVYLLRPDQHVCARWREFDLPSVRAALARATCND